MTAGSDPGPDAAWAPGTVWAPCASTVELVVDGSPAALERDGAHWRPTVPLAAGSTYGFRLDGSEPLPDPRSRWQPHGPTGPSTVDDPGGFAWTDHAYRPPRWDQAVVYELHVGTFSARGDFDGVRRHLDHLAGLGVTHLELMPVGPWAGRWGWGYDGVLWWAVQDSYGSPDDLRRLVDAAHGRGLAIILDVVFNHLGPVGAVLDRFGPYTVEASTPWGRAVNLDGDGSDEVRDHIVGASAMWLRDHHVDGLRLDAVHALTDRSRTHVVAEIGDVAGRIGDETGRPRVVVAEWDRHDPLPVLPRDRGGWGLTAHWADDLHHALHVTLTGERHGYYADAAASPRPVVEALEDVYVPRRATRDPSGERSAGGISRDHFVVCLQNHDQVGNRAGGERIAQLAGIDRQRAAAALVLLGPSVPLLFAGEEWAAGTRFPFFADHADPAMARAVTEGRRAEFPDHPWDDVADPTDPATFDAAVLRWTEPDRPGHREVLAWYRTLLALRASEPALAAGAPASIRVSPDEPLVVVMDRGPFTVIANLGDEPSVRDVEGTVIADSSDPAAADGPGGDRVGTGWVVAPRSTVVVDQRRAGSPAGPGHGPGGDDGD